MARSVLDLSPSEMKAFVEDRLNSTMNDIIESRNYMAQMLEEMAPTLSPSELQQCRDILQNEDREIEELQRKRNALKQPEARK